jgi:hypothetical protein
MIISIGKSGVCWLPVGLWVRCSRMYWVMYGSSAACLVCHAANVCRLASVVRDACASGLPREGVSERWTSVEKRMRPTFRTFQLVTSATAQMSGNECSLCGRESSNRCHHRALEIPAKQLGLASIQKHYLEDVEAVHTGDIRCIRVVQPGKND